MKDVYLKVNSPAHAFEGDNVDFCTQVWPGWNIGEIDYDDVCSLMSIFWATWAFTAPVHSLNRTRCGDLEPGIRERIHHIHPCFYHASLLPPITPIIHCSCTVGGCQSVKDVYMAMRIWRSVCASIEKERVCVYSWLSGWMCISWLDSISVANILLICS